MTAERKYLYGPVPSRRLGLSYGVDIVPLKICTLDCVYCQLGRSIRKTVERKEYVPVEPVLAELSEALTDGSEADFITIAGSGEPTLNSRLGELIDGIKHLTDIPVAILTNGTLLYRQDVRADCAKVDVALPSLDAGDEQTFKKIDRPHPTISIETVISGLCSFRQEFAGQIWLEVFFVDSINTGPEQIAKIKDAIRRIRPDKVQLNTAIRPTAESNVVKLDAGKLHDIAKQLGPECEVVADFSTEPSDEDALGLNCATRSKTQTLLSMLKRRPCSLCDLCTGLAISETEVLRHISELEQGGLISSERKGGKVFFKALS
ncbi:MAG: radical SAM protein [Planctomycetes bacterium B3_Pla]|nr:MAG: radical SAM protein [Planctomycetes bacterium B3_Pla]